MRYTFCKTAEEVKRWIYEFQYCRDVIEIYKLEGDFVICWKEKFSCCGGD